MSARYQHPIPPVVAPGAWPFHPPSEQEPTAELTLAAGPAHAIAWEGRTAVLGEKGWLLLCLLVASPNHVAPWTVVGEYLWHESDCARNKVDQLAHRVNKKLEALKCPLRIGVTDRWWVALA